MKTSTITKKKAKKALNDTADFATDNYKPLLIVAGVLIAGYLLVKITNQLSKAVPDIGNDPGAGGGQPTTGGNTGAAGSNITTNQAQTIAAGLLQAMNGFGTDEQRIYDLLRGKNPVDFAMISTAFGTPRYDGAGEASWPAAKRNLTYWLNSELNASELAELKSIMPGVL